MSRRHPSAARTEIGVSAESTAQIHTMKRRRLQGETPRPRRSRSAVLPKSKANWATQSQRVDREVVRRRRGLAGRDQYERRADRVPGVHEPQKAAVDRHAPRAYSGRPPRSRPAADAQRHVLHRKQSEHRHEARAAWGPPTRCRSRSRSARRARRTPRRRAASRNPTWREEWSKGCEREGDYQERAAEEERGKAVAVAEGVAASCRDRSIRASASTSTPLESAPLSGKGDPVATDVAISAVSARRSDFLTALLNHPNGGGWYAAPGESEQSKFCGYLRE